ncbi:hypothetical protein [Brachyspira hampsonii]|uniref:Uncharacterized protein n=1 Tax=Brachyspira hampsonii 30446 TaxID=1289135 RepID=A0A2U4FI89_9SPIR|nr:hypothetical protein [Brachyspira hampsonii]EKV56931.1 hypothetical protein A966_07829 [Brachyspira hampsonii 30446]MBW5391037.1 hypothetical protein [Brachyspira hampsonii]MBW5395624.1 hypothetical protein [Brachyspira hampsonii]OEJ20102.1 hypothetical protein A9495_12900 [Brachyspira hampsonii]
MRKPIPYKKPEEKKHINKKRLFLLIIFEIIIILLSIVTTAIISLLFGINPYISAGISAAILIVFSIFVAREFLLSINK